jgi:cell division septation protein DedD
VEEPYAATIGAETGVAPTVEDGPVARTRTERVADTVEEVTGPAQSPARARAAAVAAPARPAARAAEDKTGYTVQVAAFQSRADADALARKLGAGGYESYVHVSRTATDTVPNKVRVGEVSGRVAAEALVTKLRNTHGLNGFIISLK